MIQDMEAGVGEFAEALLSRLRAARAALADAVAAEDAYAVAVTQDELDDLMRLARWHGLDVEAAATDEE